MGVWRGPCAQVHMKSTTKEKIKSLALSANGEYVVGGTVAGNLYVWETVTGALLCVTEAHFKSVRVVRFTDCGTHIVSGGEDAGMRPPQRGPSSHCKGG